MAERLSVEQDVVGSTPTSLPSKAILNKDCFFSLSDGKSRCRVNTGFFIIRSFFDKVRLLPY